MTSDDWKHHERYDEDLKMTEEMILETDTAIAPWTIVEAHDKRFATAKIFSTVIKALEDKISELSIDHAADKTDEINGCSILDPGSFSGSILNNIDLDRSLDQKEYKKELKECQDLIRKMEYRTYREKIPVVIVYEGWDASGKGGSIKRLTENMDPRGYQVEPTAAPNDIENAHHYLWRFWKNIPRDGYITIFDRSWYGRVLVERVENLCTPDEWRRAYKEINEMEEHLVDHGVVLVKFWMQIDMEEQLRRFKSREVDPYKQYKITGEDWRNRAKWDLYEEAANEMLYRTSTAYAPWTIVESNDKYYARIKTLRTVLDAVGKS
mgnify:CR=1 FL=1